MLPLLLVTACNRAADKQNDQPGVVTNILDQTLPNMEAAPANGITPVETVPRVETPPPAAAADGLVPAAMQGRWAGAAERCGDKAAALELTVMPDQLLFHESVGTVKQVTQDADGRAAVEAAFTGEGQSWTRTLALTLSKDGKALTVVNDGTAVTRKRC
ncbi:hypothetical protein ACT9ST_15385 [Sphingobium limneticum]|uniref:hypothetical protein n=2 Tax=Sphingomonadaceae TaxID=41297 RepID=UPI000DBB64EB|nr:hypothetical protein [Sphingobium limneticum]BBD01607.1 hypothetical protein YGS_C1P2862 [Sphingobium sp. YG1]